PASVMVGILGLAEVELNPLGPVQLKVVPGGPEAESDRSSPTHKVMGPPTTGAAGKGVTGSTVLAEPVPQALVAEATRVKFPEDGKVTVPGFCVVAVPGLPPFRFQNTELIGAPQASKVAEGETDWPSQIPFSAFTCTSGGAPTVTGNTTG